MGPSTKPNNAKQEPVHLAYRLLSLSKKSVLHAVPVYTAGQRLPLEGKLAAKPTDEVANKKLGKSRNFCQKSRISTSSAQCAHWAPSPPGEGLKSNSPSSTCGSLTVSKPAFRRGLFCPNKGLLVSKRLCYNSAGDNDAVCGAGFLRRISMHCG